jgi:hypothetical protein
MIPEYAGTCDNNNENCSQGYKALRMQLPTDAGTDLGIDCYCVNEKVDPRLPMWATATTKGSDADPGPEMCAGNATTHSHFFGDRQQYFCTNQATNGLDVLGAPCILDADCHYVGGKCSYGWYPDGSREITRYDDKDLTLGGDWKEAGVCVTWAR